MKAVKIDPEWPKVDAARSGELSKSGGKNPMHKTRWFYLKSRYFFYYKTPDALMPQGVVVLHENLPLESQKEAFCALSSNIIYIDMVLISSASLSRYQDGKESYDD